ncbi:hypothetical protein [Mesorhizobium sp. WSM3224]|uniref:hypothetical protein n=1 Tax=Mesorhizobium sp. WSM3224 TaxID=1040986 RepID=UPI001FD9FB32|nr:hypothetical protein [Mesorhizobium sp. WSM3224]
MAKLRQEERGDMLEIPRRERPYRAMLGFQRRLFRTGICGNKIHCDRLCKVLCQPAKSFSV